MRQSALLFAASLISAVAAVPSTDAANALRELQARAPSEDIINLLLRNLDEADELGTRGWGEPKPFNPNKPGPNKLHKDKPVPKVPNKQPDTSNKLHKDKKVKVPISTNFRREYEELEERDWEDFELDTRGWGEPKPFNPNKPGPNKLHKDKPVPKVPNKQPDTSNKLHKDKKVKVPISTNFRREYDDIEERDWEDIEERDWEDFELEARGWFEPKPFNPNKPGPNKLHKDKPVPKVPNKQPDTSNKLQKQKKVKVPISTNFRREYDDLEVREWEDIEERGWFEPKPFNPNKPGPNKLHKDKPVPKVPNKQPDTSNKLQKQKKVKVPISTNFRRGWGEPKPFNPNKPGPNKLHKDKPVPKVPNKQPDTSNKLQKQQKNKTPISKNFRRGDPKPFNPNKPGPNKLHKDKPVPKVPNKQPDTSNKLQKQQKNKTPISKNFRRSAALADLSVRDLVDIYERYLDELEIVERGWGEPKPFNPNKPGPNKLQKDKPVPKVPNKQPDTSNKLQKQQKNKTPISKNF